MGILTLKNDSLFVEILAPGTEYCRSRFDWTGIVKQVSIGNTTFLGTEADNIGYAGTEGIGLSTEFGISTPIGYWKTVPGHNFMKIGIGALKRKSIFPYSFFKDYPISTFNTDIKTYENKIEFIQNGCEVGSYKYDYTKTVSIKGFNLKINYKLKNIGKSTIKTEEYCHNFLRLGDSDVTDQFVVDTNHEIRTTKLVGDLDIKTNQILFPSSPLDTFYSCSNFKDEPRNFYWEITNKENGTRVKCTENIPVSKFALWGMKHVISPESFYSFTLKPNQELTWSRNYEFCKS
ncbi:MAG: hypothetical protein OCD02_14380 [Spirochaetaceae bacterium]